MQIMGLCVERKAVKKGGRKRKFVLQDTCTENV